MRVDSKSLTTFFRDQGIYLSIALVIGTTFWALGQPINPFTVILYSLCFGNLLAPPMRWLSFLYEKPFPYDWVIFLTVLCVLSVPVYMLSSIIVWWFAPPMPHSLGHMIATGWKLPILVIVVFGVMNFLYEKTKARLERRNVELQSMVHAGAAQMEIQNEELQRAREIQESLLPKEIPQLPGFEVASAWQPARAVGGDYFDVLKLGESRLALCIADVSGKGVPAALQMANVQASLRASVRHLDSPARVCSIINGMLCVLQCRPSVSHSGFLRRSAHAGPRRRGARCVFPAWTYQDLCADLSPGDRLLVFTDGITEAVGPHGEEFGVEKVAAFAKAHAANSAARMNQQLLVQVTEFCGGQFQDDATLLVVAVK